MRAILCVRVSVANWPTIFWRRPAFGGFPGARPSGAVVPEAVGELDGEVECEGWDGVHDVAFVSFVVLR